MSKNSILVRRKNRIIVNNGNDRLSNEYIATFLKNLESFGYTFSKNVVDKISTLSIEEAGRLSAEVISIISGMVGAHVAYRVMYPNFPRQVMAASEAELFLNAIYHYWTVGEWLPEYESEQREMLKDNVCLKVIDLGSDCDLQEIFTNLVSSKTSLSEQDKADIEEMIGIYGEDIISCIPEVIPHKEILAFLGAKLLKSYPNGFEKIKGNFETATDVLRLAVAMSGGDVSLSVDTMFRSFSRAERRLLLGLLDGCNNIEEDMLRFSGRWIALGEKLHPAEARSSAKYRRAAKAFFKIRNGIKIETFNGSVERAIEDGDIRKAVNLLKTRPGMFARSLDRLLRSCSVDQYLTVTKGFEFVADKIASPVLLQVREHFLQRNSGIPLRVFFPKGNVAKAQVVENNLTAIPQEVCDEIVRITEDAILSMYKERQPLGKIYIDERLKSYVVPFSQRSASRSLRALARGSRIPIDENTNTLRLFMYWKQPSDQRVDIDLSSVFYDSDWEYVSHISYTNLREPYACHSGDITNAPEGASEFIDLNIKEMKKYGIRYVVAAMISFTCQSYINIPECFVGWMNREAPESGEIFEPKTVQNRSDITSDTRFTIPLVIDLDRMEVIWADLSLRENPLFYNNIEGNAKGTCLMGQAIVSLVKPNLYDLFMLNGLARGEIVEKKEDADVIFSVDEGITPFDMDKIVADFI